MQKITESFLATLVPDGTDRIVMDTTPGFGLRVTPAGRILFIARARAGGRRHTFNVGEYPGDKVADARKEAGRMLDALRDGKDPMLERAERIRANEAGETTISVLAESWMADVVMPKRKPRTAEDYRRIVDQKIVPSFGDTAVTRVTHDAIVKWHRTMAKTPRRANYSLATFKTLLNYAERIELRPRHSNPCAGVETYREGKRERFLSETELAKAAEAIATAEQDGKIGPFAAAGLRLALFTGARSGEIKAAQWAHLDRTRKILRLPDSKGNEPRTIHLSDAAMEVLNGLPHVGKFIVAGEGKDGAFSNLTRCWAVARAYAGLDDVRLHDLRHSYASLAAGRGVSLQMIGKLLGHKVMATTMRYSHLTKDAAASVNDELGAAMTAAIAKGTPKGGNVVKMPRRKRVKA